MRYQFLSNRHCRVWCAKNTHSSAIIRDLWESHPAAAVLYIFNDATQEKLQTFQLFILNFISQSLERSDAALSEELSNFYDTCRTSPTGPAPNWERAAVVPQHGLARFPRVYVIIDALDEYRVSNAPAQQQLIRELETLNVSLLVTSRHPVVFTSEESMEIEIRASTDDVKMYVTEEMAKDLLTEVFRGRSGMAQEVMETIVENTGDMYVPVVCVTSALSDLFSIASCLQSCCSRIWSTAKPWHRSRLYLATSHAIWMRCIARSCRSSSSRRRGFCHCCDFWFWSQTVQSEHEHYSSISRAKSGPEEHLLITYARLRVSLCHAEAPLFLEENGCPKTRE